MLDAAYVRSHYTFGSGTLCLDVGALAEVCLFYQQTSLVLQANTLRQLLATYDVDSVIRFVRDGYVRPFYVAETVAILNNDVGSPNERHRPTAISIAHETPEDQIIKQFREVTGRSGYGHRKARAFLDAVQVLHLGQPWQDDVVAAFRDSSLVSEAVKLTSAYVLGSEHGSPLDGVQINEIDDGSLQLQLGPMWEVLRRKFRTLRGEDLAKGHLLVQLVEMLTDLHIAARVNAEISTSQLGSELLALKCRELARAAGDNERRISDFQEFTLDGLNVRSTINDGERNLDDLMKLLDRARRFRQWLAEKPIESDLAAAYLKEATAETWAAKLPAKTFRLAVLLAVGALLGGPTGIAAGALLGAGDMFLLERIAAGWRPNQFIDKTLDPFVSLDRR